MRDAVWCRGGVRLPALFLLAILPSVSWSADTSVAPSRLSRRGAILADELSRHWTRDAAKLVSVVEEAVDEAPDDAPPITLLLAIAHAETNGKILIVSEAGAVGLAQATPSAYLREGGSGKLFVTYDYLAGSIAYILKKPLGDADTIATLVVKDYDNHDTRIRANSLLKSAFKFRREGIEELRLLEPFGGVAFAEEISERESYNLSRLQELEDLLESCATMEELIFFRDGVHDEYEELKRVQRFTWKRYQNDMVRERDAILRAWFGREPKEVMADFAYEAAEIVARELDDRFSPRSMARFLRDHILTKRDQAYELGIPEEELERVTAGLYNGGSHNLLRMRSGLIRRLPETDNYMRKVPAMRARLDQVISDSP